jgi:hypothetical protein
MGFPALRRGTSCQSADPLQAKIATAGAQFPPGKPAQVDLPERGLREQFVGCVAQKVEGFERDYVIVLHHNFVLSLLVSLKTQKYESRTASWRVTRKGERATRERKRTERAAR